MSLPSSYVRREIPAMCGVPRPCAAGVTSQRHPLGCARQPQPSVPRNTPRTRSGSLLLSAGRSCSLKGMMATRGTSSAAGGHNTRKGTVHFLCQMLLQAGASGDGSRARPPTADRSTSQRAATYRCMAPWCRRDTCVSTAMRARILTKKRCGRRRHPVAVATGWRHPEKVRSPLA